MRDLYVFVKESAYGTAPLHRKLQTIRAVVCDTIFGVRNDAFAELASWIFPQGYNKCGGLRRHGSIERVV
jgi:hypothetical protein